MTDAEPLDPAAIERLRRIGGTELARRMIELYVEQGRERAAALRAGLAGGDAGAVARAAHGLKSSAGNVGAVLTLAAAGAAERQAADGVVDAAIVGALLEAHEASTVALQRVLEEL